MTLPGSEGRDTVQGGLLDGHVLGAEEDEPPPRRLLVWPLLVAAVLGVLAGVTGARMLDHPTPPALPPVIDLQVSLGAGPSGLTTSDHGLAVVGVPVVVRNAGTAPLTLTGIRITGPGAGYLDGPAGGAGANLPRPLTPGQEVDIRFGMTSNCDVALRPEPAVTFLVRDERQVVHELGVHIPDLPAIWGQSLYSDACSR
jgi:hypothetical protein